MLTSIVKATKAHYAALQHRKAADRTPLHYMVFGAGKGIDGTVYVKANNSARLKMEQTKLRNRLSSMYPEASGISVWVDP